MSNQKTRRMTDLRMGSHAEPKTWIPYIMKQDIEVLGNGITTEIVAIKKDISLLGKYRAIPLSR